MNFVFKDSISEEDFDSFSYEHKNSTFFQSSNWSKVKLEWKPIYTGVYSNDELIGVCLVLKRNVFMNFSLMYAPRGPIIDFDNKELLDFYLKSLKDLAKKEKAMSFTIDPYIIRSEYPMQDIMSDKIVPNYDDSLLSLIEETGFKHSGFVLGLNDSFQPRFTPYLKLNEKADFNKSRAYVNAEKALAGSVKIRRGDLSDIDDFVKVINMTEDYKDISLRSKEYFVRLKKEFKDDCLINFAYMDLEEELKTLKLRYEDLMSKLANPKLREGRRREYESQLNKLQKDIDFVSNELTKHSVVDIAVLLAIKNKGKAELLYAGMNRDFQKYYGSNVCYLDSINWAYDSGCEIVSFGGCSGSFDHGIDRYKVTFSPIVTEYLGEFVFVNKPFVNKVFEKALEIRRK